MPVLIEFTVANYRSFREPATLSMMAEPRLSERDPEVNKANLVRTEFGDVLRVAGIYGANASGKSNLVRAFNQMRRLALYSVGDLQRSRLRGVEPFGLDSKSAALPSEFEVVVAVAGRQFRYGLALTPDRVSREWLHVAVGDGEEQLGFVRDARGYSYGPAWAHDPALEQRTTDAALHLSVAAAFNHDVASIVIGWFERMRVLFAGDPGWHGATVDFMREANEQAAAVVRFIRHLDVGIANVELRDRPGAPEGSEPRVGHVDVLMTHQAHGEEPVQLRLSQESSGTVKAFGLAAWLLATLGDGGLLVIDELDAQLHTLLAQQIVKLFQDPATNRHNAQLVFASHDTNLLTRTLLRRDQFWFTEKSHRTQATALYSLAEIKVEGKKVRNDTDYETDYLRGKYGAIPFFGDLSRQLSNAPDSED